MSELKDAPAPAPPPPPPGTNIQAHLLRASKFRGTASEAPQTRDWSLFFFFRILMRAEMAATGQRLAEAGSHGFVDETWKALELDFRSPAQANAGLVEDLAAGGAAALEQVVAAIGGAPDDPAPAFLDWLKVLTTPGSQDPFVKRAQALIDTLHAGSAPSPVSPAAKASLSVDVVDANNAVALITGFLDRLLNHYPELLGQAEQQVDDMASEGTTKDALVLTVLHELMRQAAPSFVGGLPVLRDEAAEDTRDPAAEARDETPITLAFTFPGLSTLKIDKNMLATFPDVFRAGMAARAKRLHDTGTSAPENWEGELGLPSVHGYFTGGRLIAPGKDASESFWKTLRADIRAFNDPVDQRGRDLRLMIGMFFRAMGMEIVQIELGQYPYRVKNGKVMREPTRKEHFGFRDGLSQPFVDMGLGDTLPGGGTPDRNSTWSPVAPGEIFLDERDEDGQPQALPASPLLREKATYLVFRKLEQDVHGFRAFIGHQRPGDKKAQAELAAQFVGRWPNGSPLVLSPHFESDAEGQAEATLNDFRYAAQDPYGRKCPLGAHVRRANPRDIGGRDEVRRHRILRRAISFGGPFLEEGSLGDGETRGLLFIAANSRIDLQFELVQADWINGGELLGQAGLARCPLTGANAGRMDDSFLEAGAAAPVTALPRFVTTRGGDYFFAPGVGALKSIAGGEKFVATDDELPYRGFSMGDAVTPSLFTTDRVGAYGLAILSGIVVPPSIRVTMPSLEQDPAPLILTAELGDPDNTDEPEDEEDPDAYPPDDEPLVAQSVAEQSVADATVAKAAASSPATAAADPADDAPEPDPQGEDVVFVAQHADVKRVLSDFRVPHSHPAAVEFSVCPYKEAGQNLTGGFDLLVATDAGGTTRAARRRLKLALRLAWQRLYAEFASAGKDLDSELEEVVKFQVQAAIRRVAPARRIDLVGDLAVPAAYGVLDRIFGTPGPRWLSEMAAAYPFARQHVGDLPPEWLSALKGEKPSDPGQTTMQFWCAFIIADLIGNFQAISALQDISRQAASEMLVHLAGILSDARASKVRRLTLVDAFVLNESDPKIQRLYAGLPDWRTAYYRDVSMILLETIGATLVITPLTFASVMQGLLNFRIDPHDLLSDPKIDPTRVIFESERLQTNVPLRLRRCDTDTAWSQAAGIKAGDFVAAIISAANCDPRVFTQPLRFWPYGPSAAPGPPAPRRNLDDYLLFGVKGSNKECWGRERVALPILKGCMAAAARLQGLRRVAGPDGEPQTLVGVKIGLKARFTRVAPVSSPA